MRLTLAALLCLSLSAFARERVPPADLKEARAKEAEAQRATRRENAEPGGRTATPEKQRRADELKQQREARRR